MQITIFGANGRVGSNIVAQAIKQNIKVVAFMHDATNLPNNENVKIVKGDIYNPKKVNDAIIGSDAVISVLGSWGTPKKDILTAGMQNIIPSMQKNNIKRIVSLTGADAAIEGEHYGIISVVFKNVFKLFANKILEDGEAHIKLLQASDLQWTVVRSPVMNEKGDPKNYHLTDKKPTTLATINRKSVALSMLNLAMEPNYIKQAPFITRNK